jgi:hypothetical protein
MKQRASAVFTHSVSGSLAAKSPTRSVGVVIGTA